jgi:hypothetical protein
LREQWVAASSKQSVLSADVGKTIFALFPQRVQKLMQACIEDNSSKLAMILQKHFT